MTVLKQFDILFVYISTLPNKGKRDTILNIKSEEYVLSEKVIVCFIYSLTMSYMYIIYFDCVRPPLPTFISLSLTCSFYKEKGNTFPNQFFQESKQFTYILLTKGLSFSELTPFNYNIQKSPRTTLKFFIRLGSKW